MASLVVAHEHLAGLMARWCAGHEFRASEAIGTATDMPATIDKGVGLVQGLNRLGIGLFELITSIRDEIAVLDRRGRLVVALGDWPDESQAEHLYGKQLRDVFGSVAGAVHEAAHMRALDGDHVVYQWTRRRGRLSVLLSTTASPLRGASSNVVGVVLVTRNISSSKGGGTEDDTSLVQKAERLLELEEGIQQLASAIENYRKTEHSSRMFSAESPLHELSARERQVLELLGQGYRPRSISEKLRVSPETVRNHLKAMFRKTGTHSQEDLTKMLRESQIR